ncbi:hypothetical protein Nepgr_012472 [Nepenthes gracilis]|uniref:Uncharacterized protein n=1 Tax=Nepenthes gracilis TaxID=150966 RepID=A0AAD3SHK3_NEPGR|nr:hypothetical protein Nepgr_012472 [Nepenthes gracilis]
MRQPGMWSRFLPLSSLPHIAVVFCQLWIPITVSISLCLMPSSALKLAWAMRLYLPRQTEFWDPPSSATSSPSSQPSLLLDSVFPTLSASRTLATKPRWSSANGAPSAPTMGVLSNFPTPPSFQSAYVSSRVQIERPDSGVDPGVAQGEVDGSHPLPINLDFVVSGNGLARPDHSPDVSSPCRSKPMVACGSEVGAPPMANSASPSQS